MYIYMYVPGVWKYICIYKNVYIGIILKKTLQPDIIFTVPASRKFSVQIFYYT